MESIIYYLDCGRVTNINYTPTMGFIVNNLTDINTKIISFLEKYLLQSIKQMDFKDLGKAAEIIRNK